MTELVAVAALLLGITVGWIFAHETVAADCDRVGGFYISSKVFECKRKGTP